MPGVDGFQVCEQLKADKKTAAITVLFITAMNDAINEEQGFARGAVDYIHKPISAAVVRARVRVHLNILHYTKFLERLAARQTNDLERAKE